MVMDKRMGEFSFKKVHFQKMRCDFVNKKGGKWNLDLSFIEIEKGKSE